MIETDNNSIAQFLKKKTINNPEENLYQAFKADGRLGKVPE